MAGLVTNTRDVFKFNILEYIHIYVRQPGMGEREKEGSVSQYSSWRLMATLKCVFKSK